MAERVGFIGTGTMGTPMATRLLEAGVELVAHDLSRAGAASLLERGARWADDADKLAADCDRIFLSLPGPPQVEAVVRGLLPAARPGTVIVDLSTNALASVRALAAECEARGVEFLDSPVSGGAPGATAGTLVLMVGGSAEALERVRPLLEALSRRIFHLGGPGAGTVAKLVNNQMFICGQALFYEGLVLAAKAGLEPDALVEILSLTGTGGVHAQLAGRVLGREFDDTTFALALAEKDVSLALAAGRSLDVPMPTTAAAHQLFVEASAAGLRDKNFWAAFELVERRAATRVPDGGASG